MSNVDQLPLVGQVSFVGQEPSSNSEVMPMILCCVCATKIKSNPANMCVKCIQKEVDITAGITKQVTIFFCKGCGRYMKPPYVNVELESRELLALCLKKIKGLKAVKLVDAGFIWTEPHSRRIKVKLTIQKEVFASAILQQSFVVDFMVAHQQCEDCQKSYTEHTWSAVVQIRQKVKHKKTFFYLEQLLLKHAVCINAMGVKEMPGGLDFFWTNRSNALHMIEFLKGVVPITYKESKRLISQDDNNNTYNFKYSYYAEIAPVCKDDVVVLPAKLRQLHGGIPPLLLVTRISSTVTLLDPLTLKRVDIYNYWKHPFHSLLNSRQLVEFTILDVNQLETTKGKYHLAEVECARSSDFGKNDHTFHVTTHLGGILAPGDTALGYDLSVANFSQDDVKTLRGYDMPDVVLVRKTYQIKNRSRRRKFKLKALIKEVDEIRKTDEKEAQEYEEFLQDLEEDVEARSKINLYKKDDTETPSAAMSDVDEDFPEVRVDELLDDLHINGPEIDIDTDADADAKED